MTRPALKCMAKVTDYMSDDMWLASIWGPIILGLQDRDAQADGDAAAANSVPAWNCFAVYRYMMDLAAVKNGRRVAGWTGTSISTPISITSQVVWLQTS